MKVRKYIGANTQEAMSKLKKELGSEAVILNTRTIRQKGILGFFKKPLVEVIAAIDENENKSRQNENEIFLNEVNSEIKKLRTLVERVAINENFDEKEIDENLIRYRDELIKNGVDYNIATTILYKIGEQVNFNEKSEEEIKKIVSYNIMEYLGKPEPIDIIDIPKVIFFIGPTGVGKTTTLAKIAAQLVIDGNHKIGLITADTYRIAAVEQLRTYSEILKLPLKIIYKPEEIYKAMAELKDNDIILVDTAGRSHKDIVQKNETQELINSVKNKEVFLVLSMATDYFTLKSIINQYGYIENYKIIFTKLDEAETYGNILNVRFQTNNSLSYFAMGQNVPDDIKIANIEEVAYKLIGEN